MNVIPKIEKIEESSIWVLNSVSLTVELPRSDEFAECAVIVCGSFSARTKLFMKLQMAPTLRSRKKIDAASNVVKSKTTAVGLKESATSQGKSLPSSKSNGVGDGDKNNRKRKRPGEKNVAEKRKRTTDVGILNSNDDNDDAEENNGGNIAGDSDVDKSDLQAENANEGEAGDQNEKGDQSGNTGTNKKKNFRELTLKEIISGVGVEEAIPMPSAVRREKERKKLRKLAREKKAREKRGENAEDVQENAENKGEADNAASDGNGRDVQEKGRTNQDESESGSEGDSLDSDDDDDDDDDNEDTGNGVAAPKVMLDENGNIVIDKSSLVVSTGSVVNPEVEATAVTRVENNKFGSNITSASFKKKERAVKWLPSETARFYEGLKLFGTDFSMIEKMLPGRSRRVIKLKFKREEKAFPIKIEQALHGPRKQVNLTEFRKEAGFDNADISEKNQA